MTKIEKIAQRTGFTLIELMVVMALMAVLATLILGAVQLARNTSTETIHRSNAKAVQTALESNFAKNKRYCFPSGGTPAKQTTELDCGTTSTSALDASATYTDYTNKATPYALNTAYNTMTGGNLSNTGSSSATACQSAGKYYGGGAIVLLGVNEYAIGEINAGCTAFTAVGDLVMSGLSTNITILPTF